jgi:hypothetical protein
MENTIRIMVREDTPYEILEQAAEDVNGRISGHILGMRSYFIEVPPSTEKELREIIKYLRNKYTDYFSFVSFYFESGAEPQ